jgi:hypothetical protein
MKTSHKEAQHWLLLINITWVSFTACKLNCLNYPLKMGMHCTCWNDLHPFALSTPCTLRTRVRHILCRQPYGRNYPCKCHKSIWTRNLAYFNDDVTNCVSKLVPMMHHRSHSRWRVPVTVSQIERLNRELIRGLLLSNGISMGHGATSFRN